MYIKKQTLIHLLIFTTCSVICLLLFSLDNFGNKLILLPTAERFNPNKLFDINFEYIINNEVCDEEIIGVFIVTSYYGNVETRSAMRRAFPNEKLRKFKLRRVFLLGTESNGNQNAIVDENNRYHDLIQGNFQEAYRNLTYKHVMGLKWTSEYCNLAKYVMKMDDDIVINMYKILEVLNSIKSDTSLAGFVFREMTPIRQRTNKWFVTHEEYPGDSYPPFLSGWFYITRPGIGRKLYQLSQREKYFWIDDLFVTGILADKLKIKLVDLSDIFTTFPEQLKCCMENAEVRNVSCLYLVGPNGNDNNLFYTFNRAMSKCYERTCASGFADDRCKFKKVTKLSHLKSYVKNVKLK